MTGELIQPAAVVAVGGPSAGTLAFVRDKASDTVVRQCLSDLGVTDAVVKIGDLAMAMADLAGRPAPKLLIVDVDGAEDPTASMARLMDACSPATGVVVLGESQELSLYRHLKEVGVADYIFKPLVRELLSAACHSILSGQNERRRTPTGSLILVIGVRGGVGATSIATRLAWRLAEAPPRPVLLLDLDLKGGDAALQLDATPNQALKQALSDVERVDDLFLERGAIHVTKRLDLMASLDALEDTTPLNEDAVLGLLNRLLRRYRYVVTDLSPAQASQLPRVLKSPATVLLVSDGRLVSARDVRRWRETLGPNDAHRSTLHILNRNGAPGTLTTDDFDRAAGHAADVIIPETREIGEATNLGVRAHPDCAPLTRGLSLVFERISGETVRGAPTFLERLFA